MTRCNACHRFDHDDPTKNIEELKCGHNIHESCQKKWSKLIGHNKCILCFDGQFDLKNKKPECISCKKSFGNTDEAYAHIQDEHQMLRCMACSFEFLKHQEINHITYFCNGNRCALCTAPCNKTLKCGHSIHKECKKKWNNISPNCILCTVENHNIPISSFVCPLPKCDLTIKYHKWEFHLYDHHYEDINDYSSSKQKNIQCPFKNCSRKVCKEKWMDHYETNHSGHLCHLIKKCPRCTFGYMNKSHDIFYCPITFCSSENKKFTAHSYCKHFYEEHKPQKCSICNCEYLLNHHDIHEIICRYKNVYCPANGCNVIIPSKKRKRVMNTGDADILIADHDCTNCLICSSCNKTFLTIDVLTDHMKTHPNDIVGIANHPYRRTRRCAVESRDKSQKFFQWEDGDISDNEYIEFMGEYVDEEEEEEDFESIGSDDSDESSC